MENIKRKPVIVRSPGMAMNMITEMIITEEYDYERIVITQHGSALLNMVLCGAHNLVDVQVERVIGDMSDKKYMIHPGCVRSETDGEQLFVSAPELMALYGVSPMECVCLPPLNCREGQIVYRHLRRQYKNVYHLFPLRGGQYREYAEMLKGEEHVKE